MLFIFLLPFLFAYLVMGARYSRTRFAEITHANKTNMVLNPGPTKKQTLAAKEKALNVLVLHGRLQHITGCAGEEWGSESYRRSHCNCGNAKAVQKLELAIQSLKLNEDLYLEGETVFTPGVYKPMFMWPGYMIGDYMRGGKVNRADPYTIAQLEQLNKMGELE